MTCAPANYRSIRRIGALLFVLLCAIALSRTAYGQFETGAVVGTVTDPTGTRIPNADIELHDVTKGTVQKTKSSSAGDYTFPSVEVSTYIVIVKAPGFADAASSPFQVTVSSRQRVDMPMKVGAVAETVEVAAGAVQLDTDSNERGLLVQQQEIENLPLNGREYTDLALLAPGVQVSSVLEDGSVMQRRGSYIVNGMRSTANNFLMDGLDNNAYQSSGQGLNNQAVAEAIGTVKEFKIITSDYPAEYGRTGGAIFNVSTISGTDHFHGQVWAYFRNTLFDAYGPFVGVGKPTLIQDQFGAAMGGPIQQNKFFWYGSYQGFRQITRSLTSDSIPTMDQRNGIFYNESGKVVPLQNPLTGVKYPNGIVPASDISAFAAGALAALPAPTGPGINLNYHQLTRGQNTRDNGSLRLDRNFGTAIQSFVRLTKQSNHIDAESGIPGPSGGINTNGKLYVDTSRIAAGYTEALHSNQVLDTRLGFTWSIAGKFPTNYGLYPNWFTKYNIPYPLDPSLGSAGLNTQSIHEFTELGLKSTDFTTQNVFTINPKITYSIMFGRHSASVGYEYLHLDLPTAWNAPVFGIDYYDGNYSANTVGAPASSLMRSSDYALADFMFGLPSQMTMSNYVLLDYNMRFHSAYAEDSWRATSRLTLNYGLRYEFIVPQWESNNHMANFDPQARALTLAHGNSMAGRSLVNPQKTNFSPRFGFILQPTPRMVVRGAYGVSYILFNRYATESSLGDNGPYSIETVFSQKTMSPSLNLCPAGSQSFSCFHTLQEGFFTAMISPQYFSPANSVSTYIPKNTPTGYLQTYSLGIQWQLASQTLMDVAYVGTHGVHVRVLSDYNQMPSVAQGRPLSNFSDIYDSLPSGFVRYNSLQVKLQRQSKQFFLVNSFTWSQDRDNAGGEQEIQNGDSIFVNYYNPAGDAGISGYNQPLNDSMALRWVPRLSRSVRTPWVRQSLGGWAVTSITRLTSGMPLNLTWDPTTANLVTDAPYSFRPNITGRPATIINPKSTWVRDPGGTYIRNALNSARVAEPTNTPFGNSPRNSVRTTPYYNIDLGVQKTFTMSHEMKLELRADAFNLLNHTNWKAPNGDISSTSFGDITSAFPSRQMQLSAHVIF